MAFTHIGLYPLRVAPSNTVLYVLWTVDKEGQKRSINLLNILLKGVWHEIFSLHFFYESVSPGPLSSPLGPFQIFSKLRRDFREWMFITGVNDTGDKRENILAMHFFHISLRAYLSPL